MDWAKRALVVVHGIGTQQRGRMRDDVVSSLVAAGAKDRPEGSKERQYLWGDPVPFEEPAPPVACRVRKDGLELDVYELYWAPHASHKTTMGSVLGWMLRHTFLPGSRLRRPSGKTMLDVIQVVVLAGLVCVFLLRTVTTLASLTTDTSCQQQYAEQQQLGAAQLNAQEQDEQDKCKSYKRYDPAKLTASRDLTWGWERQLADIGGVLRRAAGQTNPKFSDLDPSNARDVLKAMRLYTAAILAVVAWLSAQILFRIVNLFGGGKPWRQGAVLLFQTALLFVAIQFVQPTFTALAWVFTLATQILRLVRNFLAESIGDIQVYVNLDENSEHFKARSAIHAEADHLFKVIAERGYDEIILFGHSLGSVIAFDIIDGLRHKKHGAPGDHEVPRDPEVLGKVKALVTFGTAFEKVKYFFDQRSPDNKERDALAGTAIREVETSRSWINIWYWNDVVANRITSLDTDSRCALNRSLRAECDVNDILRDARHASVLNLSAVGPKPWPPVHSYYLKDPSVRRLLAQIALAPSSALQAK